MPYDSPRRRQPGRRPPRPVDVHVGARVRLRRTMIGLSQERLGDRIGLTFQQVQKYERGANRIGASRLYELAQVLDVPVSFFFDDMDEATRAAGARHDALAEGAPVAAELEAEALARRETLELVRAYYGIREPKVRKRVFELTKTLGKSADLMAAEHGPAPIGRSAEGEGR